MGKVCEPDFLVYGEVLDFGGVGFGGGVEEAEEGVEGADVGMGTVGAVEEVEGL